MPDVPDGLLSEFPPQPEGAAIWAADRWRPPSTWEAMDCPSAGGRPTRWHPCPPTPGDLRAKWGPGIYRLHWRSAQQRAHGCTPPFVVEILPRAVAQAAAQEPATASQVLPALDPIVAQVVAALRASPQPKPAAAPLGSAAVEFLALEDRNHQRLESFVRHHQSIAEQQTRAFEAYLARVDAKDSAHQAELQRLREQAAAQIGELVRAAGERENKIQEEVASLRGELAELAEPDAQQPDPAANGLLGQIVSGLGGPAKVGELVLGLLHQWAERQGQGQLPPGRSPPGAGGGSVSE